MAVYSDLLFTVSGDLIDVRASIYEKNRMTFFFLLIILFKRKMQYFLPLR
jgi:hypothetical protein